MVWSLGVFLYTLLSGEPPFIEESLEKLFKKIEKSEFSFTNEIWNIISHEAKDLIQRMMETHPNERLNLD